jgi:ATP-dependent exoDNAse (exonuclease V) beta subunit
MPSPFKPTVLRRLPADFRISPEALRTGTSASPIIGMNGNLYQRHEGGLLTRALGIAVHSLLEQAAALREKLDWEETRAALKKSQAMVTARIRSNGLEPDRANQIAAKALEIAVRATHDSSGQWILSPHTDAASEVRWAGVVNDEVRTVQVDRVFRAGAAPQTEKGNCWWIVDYKTAHADDSINAYPSNVLRQLRALFAPQLQAYAEVLRKLHGEAVQIRAGLYYPRMLLFDWWET